MTMNDHDHRELCHEPEFLTSEGLRALLHRLHDAGPGAWQHDESASALLSYAIEKYRRLARKWNRDPADAGYAAFDAMRSANVLQARDPWGYVTRVVQRSIMSEAIGDRLLISPARARKGGPMVEAPTRTGDRHWLYDQPTSPGPAAELDDDTASDDMLLLRNAIADIVELLIGLGWPDLITDVAVDYVLSRTGDAGSISNAREVLRKETDMPARLGLPDDSWPGLLRVLLGGKSRPGRPTYKGVLVRLLHYDTLDTLLEDDELIVEIALAAPVEKVQHG